MIFRHTRRTVPEQVFIVVRANVNFGKDDTVACETATGLADGLVAKAPAAGALYAFMGLADTQISSGYYGLVQVYGGRITSRIFQTNTSQALGTPLTPVAAVAYLQSVATTSAGGAQQLYVDDQLTATTVSITHATVTQQPIFGCLLETIASSVSSVTISARVFLRAM